MTTSLKALRPLPIGNAVWELSSGSTFELTIKPRSGPIRVAGSIRLDEGRLAIDADSTVSIAAMLDPESMSLGGARDPRLRSHRSRPAATAAVRFESIRVTDDGPGRWRVCGELTVGTSRFPLELLARVTSTDGSLELEATTVVDHRRLGIAWVPAGPLKAPTKLVIRASLVQIPGSKSEPAAAGRRRAFKPSSSRYHFMGGLSA